MKIIIAGAGLVGLSLAQHLLLENHDIILIENDPELCKEIEEKFDLMVIPGSGSDPDVIALAEPATTDIMLAVTPHDEVNILACAVAKQYSIPKRIARIRNSAYLDNPAFDLDWIGVTQMIDPELAVVEAIYQYISTPGAIEAVSFERGKIWLREFKITGGMPIVGKTLKEIREEYVQDKILVMTVVRDDRAIIPTGDLVVEEDDDILVIFPSESRMAFMQMLDLQYKQMPRIIISGSGLTAFKLARYLQNDANVTWVLPDYEYAKKCADQVENVSVMYGDCVDEDILKELQIQKASFFIGAGANTDHNILTSLLAKAKGVKETVIVSDQPSRNNILFRSIGIDHIVNHRITTAASIMDLIHHGRKIHEIKLKELDLEAVRILVNPGSKISKRPLSKSWKSLAEKAIVGAIIRNDELFIPTGDTVVEAGDLAIVITRSRSLDAVMSLFRER